MREPYTSRINYPLLLVVVALHVALFAWALQPAALRGEPRTRSTAATPATPPPAAAASPSPAADTREEAAAESTQATADTDPRRAFTPQQWRSNHAAAAAAQDRQRFGERAGTAPAPLIDDIEQGLRRDERAAAAAAAELHEDCSVLTDAAPLPTTVDESLLSELDARAQGLARASLDARLQRLAQRQQRCAAWRDARARIDAARRAYAAAPGADAFEALRTQQQLDPPTPDLLTRLREGLRALWESQSQTQVGRALVLQLLADESAARNEAGLRLLLQLAERDDHQVEFAASVLTRGYGRLAPQPELARTWQRRAAELGADAAIDAQLAQPDTQADASQAWGWHAWRVWLNAYGCYADAPRPDDAVLLADLRALQQLDARLSADARAAAGALYHERTQRFGARARQARHCDADAAPR